MGLYPCDVSDTPFGQISTMSGRDSTPHSNKRRKVLFSDDAVEYQVDESEWSLFIEKLFVDDDKNSVAW